MDKKNYNTQEMIDALLMHHKTPQSIKKYIDSYRNIKEIPYQERTEEEQKEFTKIVRMIKIMFNNIKNKHEKYIKDQNKKEIEQYVDDLKKQFKKQTELAKESIKELEDAEKTEEAKEKKEILKAAQDEFEANSDKKFTSQDAARKALIKPSNTVNNLIGTIKKIIKYGKEYSPEEQSQKAKENIEKEKGIGISKGFKTVSKNIDKEEKEKRKSEKLAKRFAKYAGTDEEDTEKQPVKNPEQSDSPKEIDLETQINQIKSELESGNENELDPNFAEYAMKLAKNIDSEEDKIEAKNAINAVLDGYSLEEYNSEMSLMESKNNFKNRILKYFSN